ncbi:ABC transporter ATP-binding protein [Mesorhizobium sp. YM1C-6-2]|uniref:ABC transporter ATP-binding protein n=1 Tax=Mesorhizobium sp. YM1C-6-2 TaxID=1827501 RepID=UPI000EF236FE|nr:ABC transporter ATP-binding protein [Mesorhizobium sp. YM1C-6-2]RLP23495.1 ABC transporter ATP-binding protein [Mesorhizobium sp. YM1C-6-2]
MNHLQIDNLTVVYGAVRAIAGISIHVRQGETVALIGPNGAGKTSLLFTVAGVVAPRSGTIKVNDRDLAGMSAEARVANGISVVPENREVFTKLNVHENLLVGASLRKDRAAIQADTDRMYTLFPRLAERRQHMAGFLSGGEQQMLAIARALMAHPKLLMLDEPSLGLAPVVTDKVYEAIGELKKGGTSILLVEQNSERAFAVSDRAYLMQAGRLVAEGAPAQLAQDGIVEQTLFGRAAARIVGTPNNIQVTP